MFLMVFWLLCMGGDLVLSGGVVTCWPTDLLHNQPGAARCLWGVGQHWSIVIIVALHVCMQVCLDCHW